MVKKIKVGDVLRVVISKKGSKRNINRTAQIIKITDTFIYFKSIKNSKKALIVQEYFMLRRSDL